METIKPTRQKLRKATHTAAAHVEVGVQLNAKRQKLFNLFRGGEGKKLGRGYENGGRNLWWAKKLVEGRVKINGRQLRISECGTAQLSSRT